MKIAELIEGCKKIVAAGNKDPMPPLAKDPSRKSEVDTSFELLDGTNPSKPYTHAEVMKAMGELHRRIERQAANYGGKIDVKTGKIDKSKHKFFPAQIAPDE